MTRRLRATALAKGWRKSNGKEISVAGLATAVSRVDRYDHTPGPLVDFGSQGTPRWTE